MGANNGEVEETRDVSDIPEAQVDDQIDEMLADDADESATDDGPGEAESAPSLEEMDTEDWSVEDFEEQDWTLGEEKEDKVIVFKGTKFLLREPDDEAVMDIIAQEPGEEVDPKANMLQMCRAAIEAPELTNERWESGMNVSERLGLTMRVAQYIGIDDFMDFPDGGPEAQQDS